MTQLPLAKEVKDWLKTLPKKDRVKQRKIAEVNTMRIALFLAEGQERKAAQSS